MPTKLHELKLMFLVAPLDDLYDAETPVYAKWQVKENLMQMLDDYVDQMMGDGEGASVLIANRSQNVKQVEPSDDSG